MTAVVNRLRPEENTRPRGAGPAPVIALLPIGADLLPSKTVAGRAGRGRRLTAIAVVLVAVVAVAGAYLFSVQARSTAGDELANAQDQQSSLQAQQQGFAELVATQAQATQLRDALATIMATDAPWSTVLTDLAKVRGGVAYTAVNGTLVDPTAATASGTAAVPTTPGGIGTLTINGTAPDKPTVATFVDALGGLAGLADPFLSTVSAASDTSTAASGYSFTVTVTLTGDLRSAAASRWATSRSATTSGGGK